MKAEDAKALLGLLGCCCCCDEDEGDSRAPEARPRLPPPRPTPAPAVTPSMPPIKPKDMPDTPFIPAVPSWDTPQRPTSQSMPRTDSKGQFGADTPDGAIEDEAGLMTLDTGAQSKLPESPAIDHVARAVTGWQVSTLTEKGYTPGAAVLEALGRALDRASGQTEPYKMGAQPPPHADASLWLTGITAARSGGRLVARATPVVLSFGGGRTEGAPLTNQVTGTIWTAKTELRTPDKVFAARRYKLVSEWTEKPGTNDVLRVQYLYGQYHRSTEEPPENHWFTDQWLRVGTESVSEDVKPKTEWMAQGWDGQTLTTEDEFSGLLEYQTFPPAPEPPRPPDGVRFRASGVTVSGPARDNPADLTGGTLTAYGHSLSGGTWAALRDNPVPLDGGGWDFERVVVLHESGGTITAVRSDGTAESCSREVFEREVLRVAVGSFVRFLGHGHAYHTWPNQWAWAAVSTGGRALVAFDPWRDCMKKRQPDTPASWAWPGRPPKRPKKVPEKPRCPLNVALAMVGRPADDPLAKGEGPLLLPLKAEVQAGGAWGASPEALTALAKRVLYQPAGWRDELDDSTKVKGEVKVTFDAALNKAALLIRGRATGGKAFAVTVNGQAATLHKLGHNAPEKRGWHPYLLEVATSEKTILLSSNGEISRCLRLNVLEQQQS